MDDWSLLPSRNAESEPAPDPPSTMTTTTLPARLTRPRQAPPAGVTHPCPQPAALDPTALAWQPRNQSGAKPHNPSDRAPHRDPASRTPIRNSPFHTRALDNPWPFMDDREGRVAACPREREPGALAGCRGSGRQQGHRRLPQSRQRRAVGVADYDAGPSRAWRCAPCGDQRVRRGARADTRIRGLGLNGSVHHP